MRVRRFDHEPSEQELAGKLTFQGSATSSAQLTEDGEVLPCSDAVTTSVGESR